MEADALAVALYVASEHIRPNIEISLPGDLNPHQNLKELVLLIPPQWPRLLIPTVKSNSLTGSGGKIKIKRKDCEKKKKESRQRGP